ncbi:unnamed protein product [Trichobilharzia szidati]|nr:unnamed protein product [Trichobilharzia szidati]
MNVGVKVKSLFVRALHSRPHYVYLFPLTVVCVFFAVRRHNNLRMGGLERAYKYKKIYSELRMLNTNKVDLLSSPPYFKPDNFVLYKTQDRKIQVCDGINRHICENLNSSGWQCHIIQWDYSNNGSNYDKNYERKPFNDSIELGNLTNGIYALTCKRQVNSTKHEEIVTEYKLILTDGKLYLDCSSKPLIIKLSYSFNITEQSYRMCIWRLPVQSVWLRHLTVEQMNSVVFPVDDCTVSNDKITIQHGVLYVNSSSNLKSDMVNIICAYGEFNEVIYIDTPDNSVKAVASVVTPHYPISDDEDIRLEFYSDYPISYTYGQNISIGPIKCIVRWTSTLYDLKWRKLNGYDEIMQPDTSVLMIAASDSSIAGQNTFQCRLTSGYTCKSRLFIYVRFRDVDLKFLPDFNLLWRNQTLMCISNFQEYSKPIMMLELYPPLFHPEISYRTLNLFKMSRGVYEVTCDHFTPYSIKRRINKFFYVTDLPKNLDLKFNETFSKMSCTSSHFPRGHIDITWLIPDSRLCCETDKMNDLVLTEYSTVGSHNVTCQYGFVRIPTEALTKEEKYCLHGLIHKYNDIVEIINCILSKQKRPEESVFIRSFDWSTYTPLSLRGSHYDSNSGLESGFEGKMRKVSGSLSSFTGNLFAANALTKFNLRKSSGHHTPMIFQRMSVEGTSVEPPHFPVSSFVRPPYHSGDEDVGRKDRTSTIDLYFYDGISRQRGVQKLEYLHKLNASTYARKPRGN